MNIDALADSVFVSVKGYIANSQKAMEATLREFVKSLVDAIPRAKDGIDGKDGAKGDQGPRGESAAPQVNVDAIATTVLEKVLKGLESIPPAKDGQDADPEFVRSVVRDEVSRAVAALPPPADGKDGKSVDMVEVSGQIVAAAAKAVSALPIPKDGKDGIDGVSIKGDPGTDGKDADPDLIRRMVTEQMALVPNPRDGIDGKDYDPTVLRAECQIAARAAVAELPPAPAGKSITLDEVRPLIDSEIDRRMALVRLPEDGKSVTVDEIKPLLEGEVSRWELDFERRAMDVLQRAVERMPKPKDGLGFDDLTIEEKDDRTIAFVFRQGDREKRFEYTLPVMIDRGTFKAGQPYEKGDSLTYGGSLFIAQRTTLPTERPEDGSGAFRLAVKRGRDGS